MRCPTCGTDNAPDSRFCGACGMNMPTPSRLVPTVKIADDAPLAPPTRQVAHVTPPPTGPHVSHAPPSMPGLAPAQQAGLTTKPGGHAAPPRVSGETPRVSGPYGQQPARPVNDLDSMPTKQRARSSAPRAPVSDPSMSFSAAPPRPLGLIAFVLIVDLGLAGAGAFLLAKGLAKPETAEAAKPTEKKSEAPPTAAPAAAAAPTAPAAVSATPIDSAAPAPAPAPAPAAPPGKTKTKTPATTTPVKTGPVTSPSSMSGVVPVTAVPTTAMPATDVPPPPSTEAEVSALAVRSRASFDRCTNDAPVSGSIDIAFRVQPDGTLTSVSAVENSTGNAELAACLVHVISGWRVSPFQGAPLAFVRPFTYP